MEAFVVQSTQDEFLGQNTACLGRNCEQLRAFEHRTWRDTPKPDAYDYTEVQVTIKARECSLKAGCLFEIVPVVEGEK